MSGQNHNDFEEPERREEKEKTNGSKLNRDASRNLSLINKKSNLVDSYKLAFKDIDARYAKCLKRVHAANNANDSDAGPGSSKRIAKATTRTRKPTSLFVTTNKNLLNAPLETIPLKDLIFTKLNTAAVSINARKRLNAAERRAEEPLMAFDINAECKPMPKLELVENLQLIDDLRPIDNSSLEYSYRPMHNLGGLVGPSWWKFKPPSKRITYTQAQAAKARQAQVATSKQCSSKLLDFIAKVDETLIRNVNERKRDTSKMTISTTKFKFEEDDAAV